MSPLVQLIPLHQQFPGGREMRVLVNCINGSRLRFPHRKLVISFVTSAKWVFAHNDCIIGTKPLTGPSEIAENSTFRASRTGYYARSSRHLDVYVRVHALCIECIRSVLYKRHFLRIDKTQLKSLSKFLHCSCVLSLLYAVLF